MICYQYTYKLVYYVSKCFIVFGTIYYIPKGMGIST